MGTTKTCTVCQADVSTQKRVKDAQGRYYCHPCYHVANRTAPSPANVPADTYAVAEPDFSQLWEAAGGEQAAAAATAPAYAPRPPSARPATAKPPAAGGSDKKLLIKILVACGVVIVLGISTMFLAIPSEADKRRDRSEGAQRADDDRQDRQRQAALDKATKDVRADLGFIEGTGLPFDVKVEGDVKDALRFRSWKFESGIFLKAVMTWNGKHRIAAIGYTVRKSGVVVRDGDVSIPGGGFRQSEPVEVQMMIPNDDEPSKLEVTLTVHG